MAEDIYNYNDKKNPPKYRGRAVLNDTIDEGDLIRLLDDPQIQKKLKQLMMKFIDEEVQKALKRQ